jgi:hypothetical protein
MATRLPSARRRHVGFSQQGPGGALLFEASVADWNVPLDTGKVVGTRYVQVRLLDRAAVPLKTVVEPVTLDDAPPQDVRFVDLPRFARKGTTVTLKAAGTNTISGIEKVVFFAGKPVEGKMPPDAVPVPGVPVDTDRTTWTATLPVPKDRTGPAEYTVQFVTRTGVPEFRTAAVEVVDADPAQLIPGRIVGTVVEGAIVQVGLDVLLRDEKGVEKARTKTAEEGKFAFENVLPGNYQVAVNKTKTPRRRGSAAVTVVAEKDTPVQIKLFLP